MRMLPRPQEGPLRIISGPRRAQLPCPLYPDEPTSYITEECADVRLGWSFARHREAQDPCPLCSDKQTLLDLTDMYAFGRVEDGRGSLGHSAPRRFPSALIEPDVPD